MIFFSRKPKPTPLPPGWPSPYHNKCSQPACIHPNSPQPAKGVYQCRGIPGGFFCEGTYKVSSSRAQETERYLKEMAMARKAAAEEEQQRKRTISEMRRPDPNVRDRRRGRDPTPDYIGMDDKLRLGYPQYPQPSRYNSAPRPKRPSDVGRTQPPPFQPPPPPPIRRPSYAGHRPSSSQVQAEFITDQIMMHLYPERQIQPRWI